ncbi:MAG: DUF4197 domain-containing protein [Deltaproteobacteria bacterium]|nr:DUF4197 domain-containing protein [Deltaproteobacteria bacterium]
MTDQRVKYSRIRTISCLVVTLTFILSLAGASGAADWLQKGKDLLGGSDISGSSVVSKALSTDEIGAGLKEALRVGSERVVAQLGKADGFNGDPQIHIPLPENLKKVQSALNKVGMPSMVDDLELRLNRAAEAATPKAKKLFGDAIKEMTMDDAKAIYQGPDDAATSYFKGKMSKPLAEEMRPIVEDSLAQVGAIQSYDNMMGKYKSLPFVPDVKADLTSHVLDKGMDGIFYYMAKEEAAIRKNPVKRTTELLKRVFGSQ